VGTPPPKKKEPGTEEFIQAVTGGPFPLVDSDDPHEAPVADAPAKPVPG
jgi:hypothetical protein